MPKKKFKRNIHNILLQKVSEANEDIDLPDSNNYGLKSEIHLQYPTSFSCNLFNFYMNFVLFCSSFFKPNWADRPTRLGNRWFGFLVFEIFLRFRVCLQVSAPFCMILWVVP